MRRSNLTTLAIVSALLLCFSIVQAAELPARLNHQGRLFDKTMNPISGMHRLTFSIYDASVGGKRLWTESLLLMFVDGYYAATLGNGTSAFPPALFDGSARYLAISVDADGEMSPREAVQSTPYALTCANALGDITPRSISVGGTRIVDATGKWVGPPIVQPTPPPVTQGWSAYAYPVAAKAPPGGGKVATMTFNVPTAGFVEVRATFNVRVRGHWAFEPRDCHINSLLSTTEGIATCNVGTCQMPGYTDLWIPSRFPTDYGGGTYVSMGQSTARVFQVNAGQVKVYLNGAHDCADALWGPITMTASFMQTHSAATMTIP